MSNTSKQVISLFYNHVTVLDYAYLDYHKGLVGESYIIDVEFIGVTDEEGILYDFSHCKKKVKEIIDRECDHRFVVPESFLKNKKELFYGDSCHLNYDCPDEALCVVPHVSAVNVSTLTSHLEYLVMKEMPKTVTAVQLRFRREESLHEDGEKKFFFHYTHGLKQHYGNCQRLFHGHRSTVSVFKNGVRSSELEEILVCEKLKNSIHFCFWENVHPEDKRKIKRATDLEDIEIEGILNADDSNEEEIGKNVRIEYKSSQGTFRATLPLKDVYFLQEESTVENLSKHFAKILKDEDFDDSILEVRAFEGIGKGALTTL